MLVRFALLGASHEHNFDDSPKNACNVIVVHVLHDDTLSTDAHRVSITPEEHAAALEAIPLKSKVLMFDSHEFHHTTMAKDDLESDLEPPLNATDEQQDELEKNDFGDSKKSREEEQEEVLHASSACSSSSMDEAPYTPTTASNVHLPVVQNSSLNVADAYNDPIDIFKGTMFDEIQGDLVLLPSTAAATAASILHDAKAHVPSSETIRRHRTPRARLMLKVKEAIHRRKSTSNRNVA
ncbi:hypothetical protein BC940DRAFT_298709 [Gongronella butleri]|nr:hypothetical protein BC940DRAFT_298709 [Gongronella butleri]